MEGKGILEAVEICASHLREGKDVSLSGLHGGAKGLLLAHLIASFPLLVVVPSEEAAEELALDITFFSRQRRAMSMLPDPYGLEDPRMEVLKALSSFTRGETAAIVTTPEGLLVRVPPKGEISALQVELRVGFHVDRTQLLSKLIDLGYERVPMVETRGEVSARGAIIDVFPPEAENPIRIEVFEDRVESIRTFDPITQRSLEKLEETKIGPARLEAHRPILEELPLPLVLVEPDEVMDRLRDGEPNPLCSSYPEVEPILRQRPKVSLNGLLSEGIPVEAVAHHGLREEVRAKGFKALTYYLRDWLWGGYEVHIVVSSIQQAQRLQEILEAYGLKGNLGEPKRGQWVGILVGELSQGFLLRKERLVYLTEEEIFGRRPRAVKPRREKAPEVEELRPGDYVVHVDYGIGIFRGLRRLEVGAPKDFLLIEYEGGDRLYVPVDRMNLVHRWVGPREEPPKLSRLGGIQWRRAKRRARKAVEAVARELVELYAARKALPGFAFSPPDFLFREFEATFPYEETPDQLEAIEAVLRDMCSPTPMDRLICGDVGFGKTEVAIRAAFKAVMDGKQVAVLVPTTVLAEQHYRTFRERFDRYPVVVEVLSRFRSKKEQAKILEDLRAGRIDIIIGTHRILQKDVAFKDLGLLIIDEEQRFGVAHKERLKELKKTVDCLTLTATPIPRTLQMALVGIKEMSLITTPPPGRQSIKTRIIPFDPKIIRKAILEELQRGGQVFFIHNRVADIFQVSKTIGQIVPEARIGVGHGQMRPKDLEKVMMDFVRGDIQVLVSTSIVELGLDIPNANTIIINDAHTFGLSDLYQLRGRVGRSWKKAFAYLIVPSPNALTKEAKKRLKALEELSELGSGFRLAMRDLEIRGAGTLFGHRQSGHIADVGLELYNQMLEDAIRELKGEEAKPRITPEIRVPIEAYIPDGYIEDDTQRLLFYRRLSSVEDPEEIASIEGELIDRYGPLPQPVLGLLEVIRLKTKLQRWGVERLEARDGEVRAKLARVERPEALAARILEWGGKVRLTPDGELIIRTKEDWREGLKVLEGLLSFEGARA